MNQRIQWIISTALAAGIALWTPALPPPSAPQGATPAAGSSVPFEPQRSSQPGIYVGISSCSNGACHGAVTPQEGRTIFGNEYQSRVLDPHYRAYDILDSALSRTIAETLEPGKSAYQIGLCLDCHTVNVPDRLNDGLYVEDGISCEGCHGPAGGWGSRHFEDGWSRRQSLEAGMNDLRNIGRRAEICMSCHLGTEDKAVDHRLIAAGHPRLSFELDNYSEDPNLRHWKYFHQRENKEGRRPTHGIGAWAMGQATAFRQGLLLLASKAEADGPWPEFSELNCTSCHHSLEDSAWRQRQGYRFSGGLPPWNPARWTVLRHLLASVDDDEAARLDQQIDELAARVRSFSGREEVALQARAIADALEPLTGKLERVRWNRDRARDFIRGLSADRERLLNADVAAAEQVAWSLQSLTSHLTLLD
ncbi:MAG: multiheme c-type cytochrome, partial [Thermoanaerobaculia bacterium]